MAYSYLGIHVKAQNLNSPITASAVDTSGADLLVASIGFVDGVGQATAFSGTTAGVFTSAADVSSGGTYENALYYKQAPTTNAADVFSFTSTTLPAASFGLAGFSGSASSPVDQSSTATTGGATSLATGSITPSENNELIIAGLCGGDGTGSYTINGGFTIIDQYDHTPGVSLGFAIAYLIQTTATAANPTWSWSGSGPVAVSIVSFKAQATASTARSRLLLLGVG